MEAATLPKELRFQTFEPTGGTWAIHDDHIVELVLGPRVEEHKHVVAEAHWVEELYNELKGLDPGQKWNAIVSLAEVPSHPNPPLEMRVVFAEVLKDPQTRRVGVVNVTVFQKGIIKTFLITSSSRHKLKFFDTVDEARAWVLSEGGQGSSPISTGA